VATPHEIGEHTLEHASSLAGAEAFAAEAFRPHVGALAAALPAQIRSVDVKHVWRSGPEWHVEAEVTGDEGAQLLLLRYLDASPPVILGGAVRSLG
jgi:hypothetical protein